MVLSILWVFAFQAMAEIDVVQMAQQLNPILYMRMQDKSEDEMLEKLDTYEQQINNELSMNPTNPELYWLLGLHAWCVLYAWDNPVSLDKNREQKEIANSAFRKALDNSENPKLSVDALYSIKKFAPPDVHVEAAHRIIEEDTHLDSQKELEIRGGMANHLIRLGRYNEAINTLEEWGDKYPEQSERMMGYRNQAQRLIDKEQKSAFAEKQMQTQKTEPKNLSISSTSQVEKPVAPSKEPQQPAPKVKKPAKHSDDGMIYTESDIIRYVVTIALILIGLAVIAYILRRKKE